jgi:hypothetical protein
VSEAKQLAPLLAEPTPPALDPKSRSTDRTL